VQWVNQLRTKPRALVLIFFLVGLSVRLAVAVHTGLSAPLPSSSDDREYDSYAWNLAQGHGYRGISPDVRTPGGQLLDHPTAYRLPGASLFMAALYLAFGHHYAAVRIAQCVLDTANILLIYEIGNLCFDTVVVLFAAGLYAFWPTALFYLTRVGSESLYAFLFYGFIYATLKFAAQPGWTRAAAAGVILGCCLLTRGNAIMMVALLVPWALLQSRKAPRLVVRGLAIPLVALAMLVPWTVRNYRLFHAFIPFETGGGDVVLGSNNRVVAGDPLYYGYWVFPTSDLPEYRAQITAPNNEVVRDHVELRLAIQWIRDHPGDWWYLLESRFRRSLTPFLEPRSPRLYRVAMLASWGPILVLFAFAFWPTAMNLWRTGHPGWILHLGIIHFLLTALVFWGSSRFRYPVEGLCLLLAGVSIVWLLKLAAARVESRIKVLGETATTGP